MDAQSLNVIGQLLALNLSLIPLDDPADTTQTDPKRIGKVPVVAWKQYQGQPADADQLEQWFGNGHNYNIGIVTGAVSGVVVVDLDSCGAAEWAEVHLPKTPMRTQTAKGRHDFYRHPGIPVRNKARLKTANQTIKLDVRGDGGYVVGPGSVHETGVRYEMIGTWPDTLDALPVFDPAWLATAERPSSNITGDNSTPNPVRQSSAIAQERLRRARAYLRATPPAIQGQGGDTHTYQVVCRIVRGFDLAESDARDVLQEWNTTCIPAWSERELDEKIAGALKYGTEPIGARAEGRDQGVTGHTLPAHVTDAGVGDDSGREHTETPAAQRTITLTSASAITVRPVRWLEADRLALGTLGLLGGREGVGKTIYGYTLTAGITRGILPGVYYGTPRGVIVVATEDSWEHTIVPRLMAAGADLDRVYRVDVVTAEGTDTMLSLPCDLVALERVVRDVQAALILLDPLLSRLDAELDTHKDAEVRIALEPLVTLAETADVYVLGIIHVNKSSSTDPLTMLMGSRAFAAVARSVLFVLSDPEDETVRLLGQPKNNLGRTDLPTRSFRIVGEKVADTDEGPVWTGKLDWLPESDRSIAEAVDAAAASSGDRTATSEAADWLHDFLTDQGGACDSATIKREGGTAGHSANALKRARQRLRVICEAVGFPRRTYWQLPQSDHARGGTPPTGLTGPTGPTESGGRHRESTAAPINTQLAQSAQSGDTPRARELTDLRGNR